VGRKTRRGKKRGVPTQNTFKQERFGALEIKWFLFDGNCVVRGGGIQVKGGGGGTSPGYQGPSDGDHGTFTQKKKEPEKRGEWICQISHREGRGTGKQS